ncbi:alpha/beta hydrolase [Kribbella sp. NPDC056861]|uniref:alpha/beta hydrolase n=1 Tax=Kribbella sp. NPDC056861 TaxID=3154857 RepID=UPI00343F3A50
MRLRLALVATATLALIAPAVPAAATAAPAVADGKHPRSLVFGACPEDIAGPFPALTCATLTVPLDYSRPRGATVSVLVTKHAARNPAKRLGSLLVNPGGPGGGGAVQAGTLTKPDATGFTRLEAGVLDAYDVIGFDPRGVWHSSPISCAAPDHFGPPQPDPDVKANRGELWSLWSSYAQGCTANNKEVLPHLGTVNVARDMDTIRAALGDQKLNYVGFSYGTYLGAVYGKLYPQRVGRMILDGNVDPTPKDMWYQAGLTQSAGLQKRFDEYYLPWVAKYDNVFHLGKDVATVRAAWTRTLTEFRTTPHGVVGGNELLGTAAGVMFSESGWIPFTQALSAYAVGGDDADLVDFATPSTSADAEEDNAIFNAVICADSKWSRNRATYEKDAAKLAKTSQFAWYNIWASGSACQSWGFDSPGRVKITGAGLPGVLLYNTIGDPSTPYSGALKMHQALPTSVLVTEKNSGKHCVFANSRAAVNPAANAIGTKYLLTGELPSADTTVAGHPLPVPTPAATAAAKGFELNRATPVE